MPLNVPKTYTFSPKPVGPVLLKSKSATRARLSAGNTYFRSNERGEGANLIKVGVLEDLTLIPEGIAVTQHTGLKPDEMIFPIGISNPDISLFQLNLKFDEELRITVANNSLRANIIGIRWQIAGGETLRANLGTIIPGKMFSIPGVVGLKLQTPAAQFPNGASIVLRPRTRRYTLEPISVTDPDTMFSTIGWDVKALRNAMNASDPYVRMPERANDPFSNGEDAQDTGTETSFITAFDLANLQGGNGLPLNPIGFNTGPARVLVHLNYAEKDDGTMGEFNQIYEWVGSSATIGSWQKY
jgi:hypothetical protein